MTLDLAAHYLDEARRQMRGHKRMGEAAMAQLRDQDFFVTLDPESNSVAILVEASRRQHAITLHRLPHQRRRKARPFSRPRIRNNWRDNRAEVMRWWEEGWACVSARLKRSSRKTCSAR